MFAPHKSFIESEVSKKLRMLIRSETQTLLVYETEILYILTEQI